MGVRANTRRILRWITSFALVALVLGPSMIPSRCSRLSALLDTYHGEIDEHSLTTLSERLAEMGVLLSTTGGKDLSAFDLGDFSMVMIISPFRPYTADEVQALVNFTANGGSLLLIGGPRCSKFLNDVSQEFNALFSSHEVLDGEDQGASTFLAYPPGDSPIPDGVTSAVVSAAGSIDLPEQAYAVLISSNTSWADTTPNGLRDLGEPAGPLVLGGVSTHGEGRIAFVSSPTALTDQLVWGLDNEKFAVCLISWLLEVPLCVENIERANTSIEAARSVGVDVSIAETALEDAQESFLEKDYVASFDLSWMAEELAKTALSLRRARIALSEASYLLTQESIRGREDEAQRQEIELLLLREDEALDTYSNLSAHFSHLSIEERLGSVEIIHMEGEELLWRAEEVERALRAIATSQASLALGRGQAEIQGAYAKIGEAVAMGASAADLEQQLSDMSAELDQARSWLADDPHTAEDTAQSAEERAKAVSTEADNRKGSAEQIQSIIYEVESSISTMESEILGARKLLMSLDQFESSLEQARSLINESKSDLSLNNFDMAYIKASRSKEIIDEGLNLLMNQTEARKSLLVMGAGVLLISLASGVFVTRGGPKGSKNEVMRQLVKRVAPKVKTALELVKDAEKDEVNVETEKGLAIRAGELLKDGTDLLEEEERSKARKKFDEALSISKAVIEKLSVEKSRRKSCLKEINACADQVRATVSLAKLAEDIGYQRSKTERNLEALSEGIKMAWDLYRARKFDEALQFARKLSKACEEVEDFSRSVVSVEQMYLEEWKPRISTKLETARKIGKDIVTGAEFDFVPKDYLNWILSVRVPKDFSQWDFDGARAVLVEAPPSEEAGVGAGIEIGVGVQERGTRELELQQQIEEVEEEEEGISEPITPDRRPALTSDAEERTKLEEGEKRPKRELFAARLNAVKERIYRIAAKDVLKEMEATPGEKMTAVAISLDSLGDVDEDIRYAAIRTFVEEAMVKYDIRCFVKGSSIKLEGELENLIIKEAKRSLK